MKGKNYIYVFLETDLLDGYSGNCCLHICFAHFGTKVILLLTFASGPVRYTIGDEFCRVPIFSFLFLF